MQWKKSRRSCPSTSQGDYTEESVPNGILNLAKIFHEDGSSIALTTIYDGRLTDEDVYNSLDVMS